MDQPLPPGLYVVATPIGNLGDLSTRAAETLRRADRILAEDKRVSAKLLAYAGATAPMSVYHDHSSEAEREAVVARLGSEAIALICDAGTPLISDPGYKLVRAARAAGHAVHTVPGPCAAIAALTLAGLPSDRFLFAGFLPPKAKARSDAIAEVAGMSVSHLKTLFRNSTGVPVYEYVLRRRVERAQFLLRNHKLSIAEIAVTTGFAHQSHMARCMRRILGATPSSLIRSSAWTGHLGYYKPDSDDAANDLHANLTKVDGFAREAMQMIDGFIAEHGLGAPAEEAPEPRDGFAQQSQACIDVQCSANAG